MWDWANPFPHGLPISLHQEVGHGTHDHIPWIQSETPGLWGITFHLRLQRKHEEQSREIFISSFCHLSRFTSLWFPFLLVCKTSNTIWAHFPKRSLCDRFKVTSWPYMIKRHLEEAGENKMMKLSKWNHTFRDVFIGYSAAPSPSHLSWCSDLAWPSQLWVECQAEHRGFWKSTFHIGNKKSMVSVVRCH